MRRERQALARGRILPSAFFHRKKLVRASFLLAAMVLALFERFHGGSPFSDMVSFFLVLLLLLRSKAVITVHCPCRRANSDIIILRSKEVGVALDEKL